MELFSISKSFTLMCVFFFLFLLGILLHNTKNLVLSVHVECLSLECDLLSLVVGQNNIVSLLQHELAVCDSSERFGTIKIP